MTEKESLTYRGLVKKFEEGSVTPVINGYERYEKNPELLKYGHVRASIAPKLLLDRLAEDQLPFLAKEYAKKKAAEIIGNKYLRVDTEGRINLGEKLSNQLPSIYPGQITSGWYHVNKGSPLHEALREIIVKRILDKEGVSTLEELTIKSFESGSLSATVSNNNKVSISPNIPELQNDHIFELGRKYAGNKVREIIGNNHLEVSSSGDISLGTYNSDTPRKGWTIEDIKAVNEKKAKYIRAIGAFYPDQIGTYWNNISNKNCPLYSVLKEIVNERTFTAEWVNNFEQLVAEAIKGGKLRYEVKDGASEGRLSIGETKYGVFSSNHGELTLQAVGTTESMIRELISLNYSNDRGTRTDSVKIGSPLHDILSRQMLENQEVTGSERVNWKSRVRSTIGDRAETPYRKDSLDETLDSLSARNTLTEQFLAQERTIGIINANLSNDSAERNAKPLGNKNDEKVVLEFLKRRLEEHSIYDPKINHEHFNGNKDKIESDDNNMREDLLKYVSTRSINNSSREQNHQTFISFPIPTMDFSKTYKELHDNLKLVLKGRFSVVPVPESIDKEETLIGTEFKIEINGSFARLAQEIKMNASAEYQDIIKNISRVR